MIVPTREVEPEGAPLTKDQEGLIGLLDYVLELTKLHDKVVWSLEEYKGFLIYESEIQGRIGISHDKVDEGGPIFLCVERLLRAEPPLPPESCRDWLTVHNDPLKIPDVHELRVIEAPGEQVRHWALEGRVSESDTRGAQNRNALPGTQEVTLRLRSFPEAASALEIYLAGEWTTWAQTEKPRRETIKIYERLFSLLQAIKADSGERPLELVWGVGLARWNVEKRTLNHPLLEQLVEVELAENSSIFIRPRDVEPRLALKPFDEMENPASHTVAKQGKDHLRKLASDRDFSPFDQEAFAPILRVASSALDQGGRYHPDVAVSGDRTLPLLGASLVITDTWAVYTRPRSSNFFQDDLERLKEAVRDADEIPEPATTLVRPPSDKATYTIGGHIGLLGDGEDNGFANEDEEAEQKTDHTVFFPKAFNEDQVAIVERLNQEGVCGVVVQGPPGTGKTHTIANIICHYLASGKRVLVTSKTEGALTVLRDQIPEGVRDLTISLLTSEREGLKQLETTVNVLASTIARLDTAAVRRQILDAETAIVHRRSEIDKIDRTIRGFAEDHLTKRMSLDGGGELLPMDLAKSLVAAREMYAWFVDRPAEPPTISNDDFTRLAESRRAVGRDLEYLRARLPSPSDFPSSDTLMAAHKDLCNAAKLEAVRANDGVVIAALTPEVLIAAERVATALTQLMETTESTSATPWISALAEQLLQPPSSTAQPVCELIAEVRAAIQARPMILAYGVVLPAGFEEEECMTAVRRAAAGGRVFPLFPPPKARTRSIISEMTVLETSPRSVDDWRRVADCAVWTLAFRRLQAKWRALQRSYSLADLPTDTEGAALALEGHLKQLDLVLTSEREVWPELDTLAPRVFPELRKARDLRNSNILKQAFAALKTEMARGRFASARAKIDAIQAALDSTTGPIVEDLRHFLTEKVGRQNYADTSVLAEWTALIRELSRIKALDHHLARIEVTTASIAQGGAPAWAQRLRFEPVVGPSDPISPPDWEQAWNWARSFEEILKIDNRGRLNDLDQQRQAAEDDIRLLFQDVVRLRTLIQLKARITNRVDAALQMFLTAIRRIGKGTGKSASRLRNNARDAMEVSYSAVPCWIMPTWRISESLPATLGSFDLVIIDEASQSDITAAPALFRAKKVLIVGDDKQVSPTSAFIEERAIRSFDKNYLGGQPFAPLLLPGNSLYDLALAAFPGRRIMLREHFRCVEPIIRFSCQFYADEILPVRVPKASERLNPPLVDVYVSYGVKDRSNRNPAEAEAIVDEIERIVGDPTMRHRTIGVISLVGDKQAQLIQKRILDRLGEDVYVAHDIACGDSATFQGKERDIIFISMVECPKTKSTKTAGMFQQRYNVAFSRARDREYLFHSVTEDMLNPDDLKAKVLRHFRHPMGAQIAASGDLMALCDSDFERDVLSRLQRFGYRVKPQVRVGAYSIDLVIEGQEDRRLAVELDGDKYHGPERWAEDLSRQRILERVGWRFWRCWGSSYALDPDGCLDDLISTLTRMEIYPAEADDTSNSFTEFRQLFPKMQSANEAPFRMEIEEEQVNRGGVAVGDQIQIQVIGESSRIRNYTLTRGDHAPDLGMISAAHPSGAALLGAEEESEVAFELGGRQHSWMLLKILKPDVAIAA